MMVLAVQAEKKVPPKFVHCMQHWRTSLGSSRAKLASLCILLWQVWSPFLLGPWRPSSHSSWRGDLEVVACRKLACGQPWSPGEAKFAGQGSQGELWAEPRMPPKPPEGTGRRGLG